MLHGLLLLALTSKATPNVHLKVLPTVVYRQANTGDEPLETYVFDVLVAGQTSVEPESADLKLKSANQTVEDIEMSQSALASLKGIRYRAKRAGEITARSIAAEDEQFDLRHRVTVPSALHVSEISYSLKVKEPHGQVKTLRLSIPVQTYRRANKLIFPIKGVFTVVVGPAADFGHTERSQMFALDIVGLGEHCELLSQGDGSKNTDFAGWGRPILAPADGTVVAARNDVPSQPHPGVIDRKVFFGLPNPVLAAGGNYVVIDHGHHEYSYLAHMQPGSVRVKPGDRVKQGQVIGLLGSSGNADGPHLHYHLMSGPEVFRSDGLPVSFTNLDGGALPERGAIGEAK